jgi:hypothetical protein
MADTDSLNMSVLDVADRGTACHSCGEAQLVFIVHCINEELRPVAALCKSCAVERAGGEARVWVRSDRGTLRQTWKMGARATVSAARMEALDRGRRQRHPQSTATASARHGAS